VQLALIFLLYFLPIVGLFALFAYFVGAVRRNFRSARAIWIAVCLVHLTALLAVDYYHPVVPGKLDDPHILEESQWLSNFPTFVYCFPSSILAIALEWAVSSVLCPIVGEQACDSELAFVGLWWLIPVTLGYLQWFILLPWLFKTSERRSPELAIPNDSN
jgi:hypothetical protein